ncbi:hypothetical protein F183_A27740 [Bryobacterales bacterium F-183]|nr:hypothetical protein F183_A27740 [Bryobacterales bacterium F-183]
MLQGHTFHSFTKPELRTESAYVLSQFVGGLPPVIFLYLTGVTFAFILDSNERRGLTAWERWVAALKRARYLFVLAILFRIQLWAFAWPWNSWTDLFKVDVLNMMGLTLFLLSPLAVVPLIDRVRLSTFMGLAIAVASPLITQADWTWMHPFLAAYIVPNFAMFPIFPWASFVAFGVASGCLLKRCKPENLDRMMQWSAIFGFVLLYTAQYLSNLPYSLYAKSDFWLDSPGLVFMKLGAVFILAAFAYLWGMRPWAGSWSWVRQLGTTSLLVYWVHIELVYGRWFGYFKDRLDTWQVVVFSVLLILLMIGLSVLQTRLKRLRASDWKGWFSSTSSSSPQRVPASTD